MNLNPKINIPGKFGRVVENVFDYVSANRRSKNILQTLSKCCICYGICYSVGVCLGNWFTSPYEPLQPNYPTHQEIVNFFGERALRQYEKEKSLRLEKGRREYERRISELEETFLREGKK